MLKDQLFKPSRMQFDNWILGPKVFCTFEKQTLDGNASRSNKSFILYLFRLVKIGNLRSCNGNCNENVTWQLNFALTWVFCDYSMLITLYKMGELHFRLLGTNGFHVKAKSERSTAASLRSRQNLKYENSTSSFSRLRQNIATKSVPHV